MPGRYIIGIDLGTTNTCVARVALDGAPDPHTPPPVELFPVPQLVEPGELREEPLLPSALYLPGRADFAAGAIALPWDEDSPHVVGSLARKRGVESAARLVASAKSWLCHGGVDRTSPLLPFGSPEGIPRVSPVEASRRYLDHIRRAWNWKHPDAAFEAQTVVLTVPASFDAGARELTETAAIQAGFCNVVLLEEPQAAFYAWIERHPDWRERVQVGDLILVIDIGGGTTDFSLIAVRDAGGELQLERVAVGEHILLGGDNIDLALAHSVARDLEQRKIKLDAMQFHALWQRCRLAKEALLEEGNTDEAQPVTVLGRGSGLVGGTIRAELRRAVLEQILLDGFLPVTPSTEIPQRPRRSGLQEIGLPYAADAAITRHLAKFLRQSGELMAPTHVLFNGGVLRAPLVRQRILEVLNGWLAEEGKPPVQPLLGEDLMHAVARGAAYYGLAREGRGVRIRGGIPKTYYVGIESAMPAVPGLPAPMKYLAVASFGMEEGSRAAIPQREFGLIVGEPAEFRFFCSASRRDDQPGALIEEGGEDLEELSPVSVTLPDEGNGGRAVPVTFETVVTETGMLQLWCLARDGRRWKLEFNVRRRP